MQATALSGVAVDCTYERPDLGPIDEAQVKDERGRQHRDKDCADGERALTRSVARQDIRRTVQAVRAPTRAIADPATTRTAPSRCVAACSAMSDVSIVTVPLRWS